MEEVRKSLELSDPYNGENLPSHIKRLPEKAVRIRREEGVAFVHGTGRQKSSSKSLETPRETYSKALKNTIKALYAATTNSYSKQTVDATLRGMKEDAMHNGQLKPAYTFWK